MNQEQAFQYIQQALAKALADKPVSINMGTDLVEEEILDSLDSMVFLLELSELTGKKFPETDLVESGLYRVEKLVEFLVSAP